MPNTDVEIRFDILSELITGHRAKLLHPGLVKSIWQRDNRCNMWEAGGQALINEMILHVCDSTSCKSLTLPKKEKKILCLLAVIEGWLPELHVLFATTQAFTNHIHSNTHRRRHIGLRCHRNSGFQDDSNQAADRTSHTLCITDCIQMFDTLTKTQSNYNTNFFFNFIT